MEAPTWASQDAHLSALSQSSPERTQTLSIVEPARAREKGRGKGRATSKVESKEEEEEEEEEEEGVAAATDLGEKGGAWPRCNTEREKLSYNVENVCLPYTVLSICVALRLCIKLTVGSLLLKRWFDHRRHGSR